MKNLKYLLPILFVFTIFTSCDTTDELVIDETENLIKVQEFRNETHIVEVYTESGNFYTGYNDISIRIKDKTTQKYLENVAINWMPTMEMPTMTHSCPKSDLTKVNESATLYNGYTIFQMTGLDASGWSFKFMYTVDGVDYMVQDTIMVLQSTRQNVTTFTGTDSVKYIMALVEPNNPKIAINDMVVGLYKMENMMSFPVVENYTITLDPRMPSMGNHSSPNNTDLTYSMVDSMYHGDLSLTMTGYWKLNLKLLDAQNTVLKGEDIVDGVVEESSLYLEIEF